MLSDNLLSPAPDRHWKFGPYDVELIRLGLFAMDGGAMFGVIPKSLWQRTYPHADEQNRVQLAAQAVLIRGNGLTLVADAGLGDKLHEKMRGHFAVQQPERALPRALEARDIAVEDVTHFIYTHLHFDHCGGATEFGPDGKMRPVFPKAKYLAQAAHLAWANHPSDKDKASFLPENWDSVVDAGQLKELEGETALAPGIDLRVVHGHTPGMMMILVHDGSDGDNGAGRSNSNNSEDGSNGILFSIDLFPTAAHITPHYVGAIDNHPLASLDEKRFCLEEVAGQGWLLAPGHDAFTPPGRVVRDEKGRWTMIAG